MSAIYFMMLFLVHITYGQMIDECMVTYIEQPPTELQCNPYATQLTPSEIFIRYGCRADSPVPLDDFKLTWFRESMDGTVENLGCPLVHIDTPTLQRCLLDILGETEPGSYWCVASYTIDGNVQMLERSNVGHIERETAYVGLPRCDGTNSEMVSACADISSSSKTATSTVESAVRESEITATISSSSTVQQVFTNDQQMQTKTPAQTNGPEATNTVIGVEVTEKTTTSSIDTMTPSPLSTATNTMSLVPTATKTKTVATASTQAEQTSSPATTSIVSDPQVTTVNNSVLSSDAIVISLLVACAVLLISLLATITLTVVIVVIFRRKINHIRRLEMEVAFKASSRTQDLEGSGTLPNDKYVYPLTTGIYSVPSREETVKGTKSDNSSSRSSNDSGRSSQQSYQSLLCTNMEYTSIYTTTNLMKQNSSETQATTEV